MLKIKYNKNHIISRKFHIYKIAGNYLELYETDLQTRKASLEYIADNYIPKTKEEFTISFIKSLKKTGISPSNLNLERSLEATQNIKSLCYKAYDLCKLIDEKKQVDFIDEMLYDFIELTNEMYPCISKNIYNEIKKIKTN